MAFDFQTFLRARGVHFITDGKNVKRGNINIKCPFCGERDKAQHLGIEVKTGYWGCWRDPKHRGRRPERLIMALMRCSFDQAKEVARDGGYIEAVGFDELKQRANRLFTDTAVRQSVSFKTVEFDKGICPISSSSLFTRFHRHLLGRGFKSSQVPKVIKKYRLHCSLSGRWRDRIVFPFYVKKKLVGWTARALGSRAEIKYLSYPGGDVTKDLVYGYDDAMQGGRGLVVVEGPIDRIKADFYARRFGMVAVGLLGVSVTQAQIDLLMKFSERFDRTVLLLDPEAVSQAYWLQSHLTSINAAVVPIEGDDDPGAMKSSKLIKLMQYISDEVI